MNKFLDDLDGLAGVMQTCGWPSPWETPRLATNNTSIYRRMTPLSSCGLHKGGDAFNKQKHIPTLLYSI